MEGKSTDQGVVSGLIQCYPLDELPNKALKTHADRKWQLDQLDKVFGGHENRDQTERYIEKKKSRVWSQ